MGKLVGAAVIALLVGLGGGAYWGMQREEAARAQARAERETLEKAAAGLRDELKAARERAGAAETRSGQLEADLKATKESTSTEIAAAARKANELAAEVNDLRANVASVQSSARAQLDAVNRKLEDARAQAKLLSDHLSLEAMKASDTARAEIARLKAAADDGAQKVQKLEAELTELAGMKDKLGQAQRDSDAWKRKADDANARAASLETKVQDLTGQVEQLRKDLANVKSLFPGRGG